MCRVLSVHPTGPTGDRPGGDDQHDDGDGADGDQVPDDGHVEGCEEDADRCAEDGAHAEEPVQCGQDRAPDCLFDVGTLDVHGDLAATHAQAEEEEPNGGENGRAGTRSGADGWHAEDDSRRAGDHDGLGPNRATAGPELRIAIMDPAERPRSTRSISDGDASRRSRIAGMRVTHEEIAIPGTGNRAKSASLRRARVMVSPWGRRDTQTSETVPERRGRVAPSLTCPGLRGEWLAGAGPMVLGQQVARAPGRRDRPVPASRRRAWVRRRPVPPG